MRNNRAHVVYDANVYVDFFRENAGLDLAGLPTVPPSSGRPGTDALAIINDDLDHSLWVSPHILYAVELTLTNEYKVPQYLVDRYLNLIEELAVESGGGVVQPPEKTMPGHEAPDYEDARVVDLARHVNADALVTNDGPLRLRLLEVARSFAEGHGGFQIRPLKTSSFVTNVSRARTERHARRQSTLVAKVQHNRSDPYRSVRQEVDDDREYLRALTDRHPDHPNLKGRAGALKAHLEKTQVQIDRIDAARLSAPPQKTIADLRVAHATTQKIVDGVDEDRVIVDDEALPRRSAAIRRIIIDEPSTRNLDQRRVAEDDYQL